MAGAAGALVLCAAPAVATAAETSTTFLRQGDITLPERSRIIDSLDLETGCGTPPAAGRIAVDGRAGDWAGRATMVSGTGRYDAGEFVWTDYAFDDDGTGTLQYPGEGEALVPAAGTAGKASPRVQRYGSNAADVVELRTTADDSHVYVLVRLNFLNATDSTVVGLALDLDRDSQSGFSEWPREAGMRTPGTDLFVTAYGECGYVQTLAGERSLADAGGSIATRTARNVMELALPRALLGGSDNLRLSGGAGLWDPAAQRWMRPTVGAAGRGGNQSDRPAGGQGSSDPGVFNLLFRGDEGLATSSSPRTFQTARQNEVLREGTSGQYAVAIEPGRLEPGAASDPLPVRRGDETAFTRLYRSRVDAEGVVVQGTLSSLFLSRYQPYGVYLPLCYEQGCEQWRADRPPGQVVLHGGGGSHIGTLPGSAGPTDGVNDLSETYAKADRAFAPLVVTPLGRGQRPPWWRGYGEADVLEVREAAQSEYGPDPERWLITGVSLGGQGTLRLGSLYPELWAGAFPHCPSEYENSISGRGVGNAVPSTQQFTIEPLLPSLLNVPTRMASGTADPLVPIAADHRIRDAALAAELDYRYTEYLGGGHCWDNLEGARTWVANHITEYEDLARAGRAKEPARVRYVIDPRQLRAGPEPIGLFDIRDLGIRYKGAYWVSGLEVRSEVEARAVAPPTANLQGNYIGGAGEDVVASIDIASHARPGRQSGTEGCGESTGLGGELGGNPDLEPSNPTPNSYICQRQLRSQETENTLELTSRNLEGATVDVAAAAINPNEGLRLVARGDGPLRLILDGVVAADVAGACVTGHNSGGSATELVLALDSTPCTVTLVP